MSNKLDSWKLPDGTGIRIRKKINTSGTEAFDVSYQVDIPISLTAGKRIRKQFKTKGEAEEWAKKQVKAQKVEGQSYFGSTDRERRSFTNVLPKLREAGIDLEAAVEFALQRMKPAGGDKFITEVVNEILVSKTNSSCRGNISEKSVETFKTRSSAIVSAFGSLHLKDLTVEMVKDWLMDLEKSNRTLMNYTMCLGEIITHGKRKGYVNENILDALSSSDRRELYGDKKEIQPGILTIDEAKRLIAAAFKHREFGLAGVITLGMFCGLRTEEIMKLDWSAVNLERGFVTVGASIAKKRRLRNTSISENAKAFLLGIEKREGPIVSFSNRSQYFGTFNNLLRKAGFIHPERIKTRHRQLKTVWNHNAMRHSFGTYHFALHGNSILTSNELGHRQGDQVLFDHYRALATKEQGEAYFGIYPEVDS